MLSYKILGFFLFLGIFSQGSWSEARNKDDGCKSGLTQLQRTALKNFYNAYFLPPIKGHQWSAFNIHSCETQFKKLQLGKTGYRLGQFRKLVGGLVAITYSARIEKEPKRDPQKGISPCDWLHLAKAVSEDPRIFPAKIQESLKVFIFHLLRAEALSNGVKGKEWITEETFTCFYLGLLPEGTNAAMISKTFRSIKKKGKGITLPEWNKSAFTKSFFSILTLDTSEAEQAKQLTDLQKKILKKESLIAEYKKRLMAETQTAKRQSKTNQPSSTKPSSKQETAKQSTSKQPSPNKPYSKQPAAKKLTAKQLTAKQLKIQQLLAKELYDD